MIHVLSPHRDDAIFSLFFSLCGWRARGMPVCITNFFTRSNYAPQARADGASAISEIRKREDRAALRRADLAIRVHDRELLDAPLRLEIPSSRVCLTQPRDSDIAMVERALPASRLAFYEDLPYAMWSDEQLPVIIGEIEDLLHRRLKRAIIRSNRSIFEK